MDDADRATVAEAADAGAFGAGLGLLSYEPDDRAAGPSLDQYASVVRFGTATVGDGWGSRIRHRLVIKREHPRPEVRELFASRKQFRNETRFYGLAAPFLAACAPFDRRPPLCRYFYGRNDRGAVVLENACAAGFRSSEHRLDLDLDHLTVALRTLAKFHGLSYRAKHKHPAKFSAIVAGFEDTQWFGGQWTMSESVFEKLFSFYLDKLIERDASAGDELVRRFRTEFLSDTNGAMRRAMEPVEPLAVLCHGDYNRNNLLFRYGDDGGGGGGTAPADALPLDVATARYGSPALDLSFFLYMNTDRRLRDAHWDRLLDEYCTALAAAVSDPDGEPVPVPDRARLDAEMRERAFYGLAHVSFFVRMMMAEDVSEDYMSQYVDMNVEDVCPALLAMGGDRATERILDVIEHFLHIRYGETAQPS